MGRFCVHILMIHLFIFSSQFKALEASQRLSEKTALKLVDETTISALSEELVKSVISIFKVQESITELTTNAAYQFQHNMNGTYVDVPKIYDSVSKSLSRNLIKFTGMTPDSKLHRVIFGIARVAAEMSVIAVLNETSYAFALDKIGSSDRSLRKRRSYYENSRQSMFRNGDGVNESGLIFTTPNYVNPQLSKKVTKFGIENGREKTKFSKFKRETNMLYHRDLHDILYGRSSTDPYSVVGPETLISSVIDHAKELDEKNDFTAPKFDSKINNNKKLETTANNAILHSGDIAHLAAETLIALRRVLATSVALNVSLQTVKIRSINRQEHFLTSLVRSAAHEVTKEARKATKNANACERTAQQAIKLTANTHDTTLGPLANRILLHTLPLASLAKSVSHVATDTAIDSLYGATDGLFRRKFIINIVQA